MHMILHLHEKAASIMYGNQRITLCKMNTNYTYFSWKWTTKTEMCNVLNTTSHIAQDEYTLLRQKFKTEKTHNTRTRNIQSVLMCSKLQVIPTKSNAGGYEPWIHETTFIYISRSFWTIFEKYLDVSSSKKPHLFDTFFFSLIFQQVWNIQYKF